MSRYASLSLALALLAGCSQGASSPPGNAAATTPPSPVPATPAIVAGQQKFPLHDVEVPRKMPRPVGTPVLGAPPGSPLNALKMRRYSGRWIGVEGMYLDATPIGPDRFRVEMQYDLDHKETVEATLTAEGLAFTRGGKALVARPTNGDATGLKYLAGKEDCLTVQPGEGYCRA